jgi:hypothetical protein
MINPTGSTTFGQGMIPFLGLSKKMPYAETQLNSLMLSQKIWEESRMTKGWKYILEKYPEVSSVLTSSKVSPIAY